ncbi:C2 domain-containing protein [Nannizzia gypsea CBS 118893]|uniref:C2 domain-containing protein n=1 Tax=Arthroderma gypseum (strain ATCC MYA-4604 / CBS 118893) TaxID=535722 RepID=E4UX59_ARTGP|nr:C2 domain-containing protein [Nannizzia gypsea CBS 118893]EFR01859.1 C2 domain-containing protein [Nannizzia gypsea CBS 118893]
MAATGNEQTNGNTNADADANPRQRSASESHLPSPSHKGPAGGYDVTPMPSAPPGWTLKFTFHRAVNLPIGDLSTMASDPYVTAILETGLPTRHPKQDPIFCFRTPTVKRTINPEWNCEWIVANVPSSGFELKCRIYDEDIADNDDRLGSAYVEVRDTISESWPGIKEQGFKVRKRMGSQRAYLLRTIASTFSKNVDNEGLLYVSVECLGRTPGQEGAHLYTVGPNYWTKHFSPLIGRLVGIKDKVKSKDGKPAVERYNFQAVQIQLSGPVPTPLYHRYVEFRPFVAGMFTAKSIRGRLLNHALHHQHERIYTYDHNTIYGVFPQPSIDLTKLFLDFVQYGQGGRIFTYVITLDGQWRFTETGKEFGIDLLSKHTMHSDVSIYIAYSGEFFVRQISDDKSAHHHHHRRHQHRRSASAEVNSGEESDAEHEPSTDPAHYELIIDNDSGTYRPNGRLLPLLKEFLTPNLPGLKISTLDSQGDATRMAELKGKQREMKNKSENRIMYLQKSSSSLSLSSLSSSDEEDLDERESHMNTKDSPTKPKGFMSRLKNPKGTYKRWLETDHEFSAGKKPEGRPATSHN